MEKHTSSHLLLVIGLVWQATSVHAQLCPGNSLEFDGVDDYVSIPSGFDTPEGTFECWFTPLDGTPVADGRWFGQTYSESSQGQRSFIWKGDSSPLSWYNDAPNIGPNNVECPTTTDSWSLGQAYHIAGTWTQDTARVFVNGLMENECPINSFLTGTSELTFGAASNGGIQIFVNCRIDEVRIWSVARTEQEIQSTMNTLLGGNEAGLEGYYRLDDCGIPVVVDSSPNGIDGMVVGDPACVSCEIAVNLDIKPGSCPNSFNRGSHGVLPVALVGTDGFDVTQIDIATILLWRADGVGGSVAPNEGPPGPHSVFEDVATPFEGELCDCHELEDDGILDLSMKFRTDDVVAALQLDELPAGDLVELIVSGTLLDGTEFSASDCIRLVPPGTPPGMLAVGSNAPGAFIDVTPLDLQLDGGGFGNFERTFPLTSIVTLTAPLTHQGWFFIGWWADGGLHAGQSIDITIGGDQQAVKAIYMRGAVGIAINP